jgi:hypothetical protein
MNAIGSIGTWYVVAHRDSETHDVLCDAMIEACGFILINGEHVYEVVGAVPCGADSWRWELRPPRACEWSVDRTPFVASS